MGFVSFLVPLGWHGLVRFVVLLLFDKKFTRTDFTSGIRLFFSLRLVGWYRHIGMFLFQKERVVSESIKMEIN